MHKAPPKTDPFDRFQVVRFAFIMVLHAAENCLPRAC